MIALSSCLRSRVHVLLLIALIGSVGVVRAQKPDAHITTSQERIAHDLQLIRNGEQQHLPPAQQGILWEQLALEYHVSTEFQKAEDAYLRALHLLKTAPSARSEYAFALDNLSSLYLIYGRLDDAESARKQAIKVRQKLGAPADNAESEVHLADIALVRHQFKKAERLALNGLRLMESSSSSSRAGILSAFITLTYARCSRGHCEEGLMNAKQAVAFANKNFESESAAHGFALETLGFAEWKSGSPQDGERDMLQSIQILRTGLAPADPRLAGALLQYQSYLVEAHRPAEAQEIREQVSRMTSQAGVYCQGCAVSVYSLSNTLR
jgi:tetratricopeptide (TPR) repeat protein